MKFNWSSHAENMNSAKECVEDEYLDPTFQNYSVCVILLNTKTNIFSLSRALNAPYQSTVLTFTLLTMV